MKHAKEADYAFLGHEFYERLEDLVIEREVLYSMIAQYMNGEDPLANE